MTMANETPLDEPRTSMMGKWVGWVRWPWSRVWGACCMADTDAVVWEKLQSYGMAWTVADCCSMPWPFLPDGTRVK